ncbi:hypothetical protein Ciccas_014533 [Cichlidogyrus casuarinus]|uniref:Serpin domain-containing protein n=1 Tax=Cichlidogyrus casuarinus TaxID=1844966 RepID=A0ABD2PI65_9PLAT
MIAWILGLLFTVQIHPEFVIIDSLASSAHQTVYSPLTLPIFLASLLAAKAPQGETDRQICEGFMSMKGEFYYQGHFCSQMQIDQYMQHSMTQAKCQDDSSPKFCNSNSMIIADRFNSSIKRDFLDKMSNEYKVQYFTVSNQLLIDNYQFSPDKPNETLVQVNDWVATNTEGKIQNFLKEIKPDTTMIFINTLYFKG